MVLPVLHFLEESGLMATSTQKNKPMKSYDRAPSYTVLTKEH